MTPQVVILPAASQDLDDQAGYLTNEAGLETALRFYDAADATFQLFARTPGMGERRDSSEPRLQGMRVGLIDGFENHLVFYRPIDDGIEIIRVLHGARDIDCFLRPL